MPWILWFVCAGFAADAADKPAPSVRTERLEDGTVRVVPDRQVPGDATGAESVVLEFADISLYDLTLYFADITRKNFLLTDEKALRDKRVRLVGHAHMTVDEAWQAFHSALHGHGFVATEVGGGIITVVPKDGTARLSVVDDGRSKPPPGEGIVTRLIPVENARVRDLTAILAPLLSSEAHLVAYAPSNTLIVTDAASHVRKALELIEELDVSAPESTLRLVRLEHADAAEVRAVLEALYPSSEGSDAASSTTNPQRRRRGRGGRGQAPAATITPATSGSDVQHISQILHDARTNSLIVLANARGHAAVLEVIAELDVDVDPSAHKSLHVVDLRYALAEEVAAVLGTLQRTSGGSTSSTPRRQRGEAATRADDTDTTDLVAALDGDVRVAADPSTNQLAVVADPTAFAVVSQLIDALDVARGQVFVDAVFVEITSTGSEELGIGAHVLPSDDVPGLASIQLDAGGGGASSFGVSTELLSGLAAGVFGPLVDVLGPDGSILSVPTFGIALRALQTHNDVKVMGNPALLALDHQEATLSVGRKVPFPVSNQLSTFGAPIQTYERVDVAMSLTVTPHVNTEELVTLDLELVVDEVETSTSGADTSGGPTTSGRTVTSRVMANHGQTVVIAGLMSTKEEVTRSKVPILGDIPILGLLFRSRRKEPRHTHLMVFLTPYVLESPSDVLEIRRMKEAQRQEFVRRFQGRGGEQWLDELEGLLTDAARQSSP